MKNYYQSELNRINLNGEFPARIQVSDEENKTTHLNLNKECAKVLIEKLQKFVDSGE